MSRLQTHNRLIKENSPYLIQHAENPVDWFPWSDEAFENAKKLNKPIFLSIGYSTCHWCHVMAHESFEDTEVAKLINDVFIPIKVDREERPDIDNIYMTVCQIMTGSGGWPLTIFMTPEKKPFYAATYIPKNSRSGRIGLLELIPKINKQWITNHNHLLKTANKITDTLSQDSMTANETNLLNINIFNEAYIELKQNFDNKYGGYGKEPKFPIPHQNLFLLNYYTNKGTNTAIKMVEKTLIHMKAGGIYDHLGFGFHRYSTDKKWTLPHFEKMLYDQALLIYLYTTAFQITKNDIYKITVEEIITYIQRKMLSKGEAFYSAEDADSDGEEGKFYVWGIDEIKNILKEESEEIINIYNITESGNYHDESSGNKTGNNILYLNQTEEKELINLLNKEKDLYNERMILYTERKKRVHPYKDDKILSNWNGLMIAALSRAAFVFRVDKYLNLAENAANFIINNLKLEETLLHRYRNGEAAIQGNLNDYSFFIYGLLNLYQSTFDFKYLNLSMDLNNYILTNFWDNNNGGFFFTSNKNNDLIFRSKEVYDGAIPSGNSIALYNLVQLSHLTGNHQLEERAYDMVKTFSEKIKATPTAYCQFLVGLQTLFLPYYDIIIVGNKSDNSTKEVLNIIRKNYKLNLSVIIIPPDKTSEEYHKLSEKVNFIKNYSQIQNKTTIYVCKDHSCKLPITDPEKINELLN